MSKIKEMTYCVAWKSLGTVFMVSDTARTTIDNSGTYKPSKSLSSIGEKSLQIGGVVVEEFVHKQYIIEDKLIMTFSANDIDFAYGIIDNTRKYFDPEYPIKSFELALDAVRDPGRPDSVQFLIGVINKNEIHLFAYNTSKKCEIIEVEENSLVQIGSLSQSDYRNLTKKMYYEHIIDLKKPSEQFYQTIAFLQHLGLHDETFKNYAGGVYTGVKLDLDGAKWADDTLIILYETDKKERDKINQIGNVNYFIRHNVFTVSSSFTKKGEYFIDNSNNPIFLSPNLLDEIEEEHRLFQPKIIILLAVDARRMVVIKTNGWNSNNHFLYRNIDGKQDLLFIDTFAEILTGKSFTANYFCNIYWNEVLNIN